MILLHRTRLHLDVLWAKAVIALVTFTSRGEVAPETHWYLADLHYRLAAEYERASRHRKARHHRQLGDAHAAAGPPPEPRPAAAMAMPVPQPPTFTDARGSQWPDDPIAS